eukprot:TRINITY_DN3175_c0_g1_i1.p1 TRINITY_DN3175_c0_g1~~TRINITY_DN3175_c0_g1_i1.p1  ORF type:complete len:593 (-),score=199.50 TRINITY_DN3175_c0_g1_i1:17-1795(-)
MSTKKTIASSEAISVPQSEEFLVVENSPNSFTDSFENLERSIIQNQLKQDPNSISSSQLFEKIERDFSGSFLGLSSDSPLEEKTVILLDSSSRMENSEAKTEAEDLQEASFGFFGNTGEKEEENQVKKSEELKEKREENANNVNNNHKHEHILSPEMSKSGAFELQEIRDKSIENLKRENQNISPEMNKIENGGKLSLNSSTDSSEGNWSSWLGGTVYSVKTYVLNCIYHWMPHASLLPEFSDSPIYMIKGRQFLRANHHPDAESQGHVRFEEFIAAFRSLFWFSYRNEFEGINGEHPTSDAGWGCMLRSGQMILSQALSCHFLGKDWELDKQSNKEKQYFQMLRWFLDFPTSPYSVHKIAQKGIKFGKNVGEWFGPSTVAQVLSELVDEHNPGDLVMYTSNDSTLYLDEIESLCTIQTVSDSAWNPIFILIPLRLGLDTLNPVYYDSLCKLFKVPQFLGIIGGKPRAAMFFVACQDANLFYLDPHTVQTSMTAAGTVEGSEFDTNTFHSAIPHKMNITSLDPSLSLGFYCADRSDFEEFWGYAKQLQGEENPLFGIQDESPDYRCSTILSKRDGFTKGKKSSMTEEDVVVL